MSGRGCRLCKDFNGTGLDFEIHHLQHIRQKSVVRLHKLDPLVLSQIQRDGFFSANVRCQKVTPIKITVRKTGNRNTFSVASETANNSQNMIGMNGISIQCKNGTKSTFILPREETAKTTENPIKLLEKLSGSGISIKQNKAKFPRTDNKNEKTPDLSSKIIVEAIDPGATLSTATTAPAIDTMPEGMLVIEQDGIDILKKYLEATSSPSLENMLQGEVDDEVIIESEIARTARDCNIKVPLPEKENVCTASNKCNKVPSPSVEQRSPQVPTTEKPTTSTAAPLAEIRLISNLGQPPEHWSASPQQDPLTTECENFLNICIDNALGPIEPPEFLSLEQLAEGLGERTQGPSPVHQQIPKPGQISVIPQRQMQEPRPIQGLRPQQPAASVPAPPPQRIPNLRQRMPSPPMVSSRFYQMMENYQASLIPEPVLRMPNNAQHAQRFIAPQNPMGALNNGRPQIQARSFESLAAPRGPVKRPSRMPINRMVPNKVRAAVRASTRPYKPVPELVAGTLRGLTITQNRMLAPANVASNHATMPITNHATMPITNHNVQRPLPCSTVDLTADEPSFLCPICKRDFSSMASLTAHKALHRKPRQVNRSRPPAQGGSGDLLGIPIVNTALPGTQVLLARSGITSYIPLSHLRRGADSNYGIPILGLQNLGNQIATSFDALGADNVFMLGKMVPLQKN